MTKQVKWNRVFGLGVWDCLSVNVIALMITMALCIILFRII